MFKGRGAFKGEFDFFVGMTSKFNENSTRLFRQSNEKDLKKDKRKMIFFPALEWLSK